MRRFEAIAFLVAGVVAVTVNAQRGVALDVIRNGRPVAVVVVETADRPSNVGRLRGDTWDDRRAAQVLVEWVEKMTGARLTVVGSVPPDQPAIVIGSAAIKAGLKLDDIDSPSQEGLRISLRGDRLLLAGQSGIATTRAVCRLLESWGCRYFVDHPLGEVYPKVNTLTIERLEVTEKPGFVYRSIWGSQWSGQTLWKVWNGAGGLPLQTQHAWGRYISKDLFETHPEYFALRAGQRRAGDWYCTSNPEVRHLFAQGVIAEIAKGTRHPSISPPDGRGYCECAACLAQDDPHLIEPSSGRVSVSTRYVDFFQDVARQVRQAAPDSILNFYCYADYTQAPSRVTKLEPNLCAWLAPIRYCRLHRIGHPNCPSRMQLAQLVEAWAAIAKNLGYRTYNYNLAECLVPFSMISIWKHDIPYLKSKNCLGINLETLANWQIYGPHIYLSIRLAYDPQADADAIMDDYFEKFYGPRAGPLMKQYWLDIDRAFVDLNCHAGGFYAVHLVYTPDFLKHCRDLLERAAAAAEGEPACLARVRMAAEGLENAAQYETIRQAMNRGDFVTALQTYENLLARSKKNVEEGWGNHYTVAYLERFLGPQVRAGAAVTASPNRLISVLPDKWRMTYDPDDQGVALGYNKKDYDDSGWHEVLTYSKPLDAQGLPDRQTILWYRTRFSVPKTAKRLSLFFTEVDGDATVFVNGQEVGTSPKKRVPFEVDITSAITSGENVVAVRVDHSQITELFLGGILRPVLLVERAAEKK